MFYLNSSLIRHLKIIFDICLKGKLFILVYSFNKVGTLSINVVINYYSINSIKL